MKNEIKLDAVTAEVIRNRLVAIGEEMRVALQTVSGSPTVTDASDFFTGLFLPDGSVAVTGFQVSLQGVAAGAQIRYLRSKSNMKVREGDMFIGNDPYVGALHQNDVGMIGPVYAGDRLIAWAGVMAHQIDVGGMDFASWCPKAKEIWQEGLRMPCVKLVDQGEIREDVLEMILAASRLPDQLGLDIRAFIATINVAQDRIKRLIERYDVETVEEAMRRMITSSENKIRTRLRELPDGEFHAMDFLEHDGHENRLYKLDLHMTKRGDDLIFDFSGSSPQAPGFINCTRACLEAAAAAAVMSVLAYDIQWNQGAWAPVKVIAPDGLVCTARFPAPVSSATVEAIFVSINAGILALNKVLALSPKYHYRSQALSIAALATFNLGGINQYGEPFGFHMLDMIAGGFAAFASKDGVDTGSSGISASNSIADVERNEQYVPLFYVYRRLAVDTGGAGKYRGGLGSEVAMTLSVDSANALIMAHGVQVPNSLGMAGGWPGSTIRQGMGRNVIEAGRVSSEDREIFGPKPGMMPMTNRDIYYGSWPGGGGWGDPIDRDVEAVVRDVSAGAVSPEAARNIYGVVLKDGKADQEATERERKKMRLNRVGTFDTDPSRITDGERLGTLGESLFLVRDDRGIHVATSAGYILSTNSTRWRAGAKAVTVNKLPPYHRIDMHEKLSLTAYYCPASGTQLCVEIHEKDQHPVDDIVLDLSSI
jgi:N-methylhydantoinase B